MRDKVVLNSRSKVGFTWTNTLVDLEFADPGKPITGSKRKILDYYQRVARNNRGNHWACWWYVRKDGEWVRFFMPDDDMEMFLIKCIDREMRRAPRSWGYT